MAERQLGKKTVLRKNQQIGRQVQTHGRLAASALFIRQLVAIRRIPAWQAGSSTRESGDTQRICSRTPMHSTCSKHTTQQEQLPPQHLHVPTHAHQCTMPRPSPSARATTSIGTYGRSAVPSTASPSSACSSGEAAAGWVRRRTLRAAAKTALHQSNKVERGSNSLSAAAASPCLPLPACLLLLFRQRGHGVEAHALHLEPQGQAPLKEEVLPLHAPQPGLEGRRRRKKGRKGCDQQAYGTREEGDRALPRWQRERTRGLPAGGLGRQVQAPPTHPPTRPPPAATNLVILVPVGGLGHAMWRDDDVLEEPQVHMHALPARSKGERGSVGGTVEAGRRVMTPKEPQVHMRALPANQGSKRVAGR